MDDKVIVNSMVSGRVSIIMPDLRMKKTWPRKGTKLPISKDFLREAIYDEGVYSLFADGDLDFDDMDFKIELGLEDEGTKAPTKVIPMDEKYMERILKFMPIMEMKENLHKMSNDQKNEFLDYACHQTDINLDRIRVIDEIFGSNLLRTIELERQKEV